MESRAKFAQHLLSRTSTFVSNEGVDHSKSQSNTNTPDKANWAQKMEGLNDAPRKSGVKIDMDCCKNMK